MQGRAVELWRHIQNSDKRNLWNKLRPHFFKVLPMFQYIE